MIPSDEELRAVLGKFWDDQTGDSDIGTDLFALNGGLDSLSSVDVLLDLESGLGLKNLPITLIKPGGYCGRDDFLVHLSDALKRHLSGESAVR